MYYHPLKQERVFLFVCLYGWLAFVFCLFCRTIAQYYKVFTLMVVQSTNSTQILLVSMVLAHLVCDLLLYAVCISTPSQSRHGGASCLQGCLMYPLLLISPHSAFLLLPHLIPNPWQLPIWSPFWKIVISRELHERSQSYGM